MNQSIYPCIHVWIYASIKSSIYQCMHQRIYLSVKLSIHQFVYVGCFRRRAIAHVRVSYHVCPCHVTYEYVTSRMNACVMYEWVTWRHVWMRHVVSACITSRMNRASQICMRPTHTYMSLVTSVCVMLHMSAWHHIHLRLVNMNESFVTWMSHVWHEWVMSHVRPLRKWVMSLMNASCHVQLSHATHDWVMSHMQGLWIESCHLKIRHVTYDWVTLHMNYICLSRITHTWVMSRMNESCHTCRAFEELNRITHECVYVTLHMDLSRHT